MDSLEQRIEVGYRYQVHFTEGLFAPANPLLGDLLKAASGGRPARLVAVIDQGVAEHHPALACRLSHYVGQQGAGLFLAGPPLVVPGGELVKNGPHWVAQVSQLIHDGGICRHSFVLAVGGGAVLDMVGYAAATAHRGVRLIRIPTTVLAQNDSGVGVKNGINAFGKKNFLGTFSPPFAVINDFDFLTTLALRDWRSGIAEAVKVALIRDPVFFSEIERESSCLAQRAREPMRYLVRRCAELHMSHIANSGDPFESGSSRPLDFGHWAAHKLEQLSDYRLRHGEAVAMGIALDATYAWLSGLLEHKSWTRIVDTLERLGFSLYTEEMQLSGAGEGDSEALFQGLDEFREHLGGELTIMLLQDIGSGVEVHEVDLGHYRDAVDVLHQRHLQGPGHANARLRADATA